MAFLGSRDYDEVITHIPRRCEESTLGVHAHRRAPWIDRLDSDAERVSNALDAEAVTLGLAAYYGSDRTQGGQAKFGHRKAEGCHLNEVSKRTIIAGFEMKRKQSNRRRKIA